MFKNKKFRVSAAACVLLAAVTLTLFASCSPKYGRIMTYEGHYITEDKYSYWLSSYKRNILYSYTDAYDTDAFWQSEAFDGLTVEEFFKRSIDDRIKDYLIAEVLFRDMRLSLSQTSKDNIEDDINEKLEYYGGKKGLNNELREINLTVKTLREVYTSEAKLDAVQTALFGEGGPYEVTEDDVTEYYAGHYSRIKYIVFYSERLKKDADGNIEYDEDGLPVSEPYTDAEKRERQELIDGCFESLKNGADFDELRIRYSEYDTSGYQNGFLVSENDVAIWGPDIVKMAAAAQVGDVFMVNDEHETYIIEKLPLDDIHSLEEQDLEQIKNIASYVMSEKYEEYFAPLREKVAVDSVIMERYSLSKIKPNPYYSF